MNRDQTYRCLIVDDQPLARDVLRRHIARMPSLELAGECANAFQAAEWMRRTSYDLMFLDVQMPQISGLELIRTMDQPYKVILTTAFEQYALQAFDLDVIDYLLKPIAFDRFRKAVSKAFPGFGERQSGEAGEEKGAAGSPFLYFRSDRKMVKVFVGDIEYIESQKDYVRIYTTKGPVVTKYSMAALEAMLPGSMFLRTHRSFIVAFEKITAHSAEFVMVGEHRVPVGRLYRHAVMRALGQVP